MVEIKKLAQDRIKEKRGNGLPYQNGPTTVRPITRNLFGSLRRPPSQVDSVLPAFDSGVSRSAGPVEFSLKAILF